MKKKLCCAFTMFVLAMNIFGEGGWLVSDSLTNPLGFGDLPKVAKTKTLASTGSPAMDAVGPDGLPLVLPGGSPQAVRDYIVAPHAWAGVHGINVGFTTYPPKYESVAIKSTHGYESYLVFLDDCKTGFLSSIDAFLTKGSGVVDPATKLYSTLSYLYFVDNDPVDGVQHSRVLFISEYVGTYAEMIADRQRFLQLAMDTIGVDSVAQDEEMILAVPNLSAIHMAVQIQGGIATMDWSLSNPKVSVLQNWSNPREWNVPGLLYLRGWLMSGTYSARVALTKKSGDTVIYTQYGRRVELPRLSIQTGNLVVTAPRGVNVILESSSDLMSWKRFGTFQNFGSDGSETLSLPVGVSSTKAMFFRGDSN